MDTKKWTRINKGGTNNMPPSGLELRCFETISEQLAHYAIGLPQRTGIFKIYS